MTKTVWLVGAGEMSVEYSKVLTALSAKTTVIGRGGASADSFQVLTGVPIRRGGIRNFLDSQPKLPDAAIVSVGVEQLADATICLLEYGIRDLLVEKPAGLTLEEIRAVGEVAGRTDARVSVAYNRRFLASVMKAREILAEDGGVKSFAFEFTEWPHKIASLQKASGVKEHWFLANSSHVADLAFYLGGEPNEITCLTAGALEVASVGRDIRWLWVAEGGALFSYQANWGAPGRWGVEVMTKSHRLILRPLEELRVVQTGAVAEEHVEISGEWDREFKPGLYAQVQSFLEGDRVGLLPMHEQVRRGSLYGRMAAFE